MVVWTCLELGLSLNDGVLIHKDPEFEALTGLLRMEALPYKSMD
jgi:hypothetical protein